MIVGWTFLIFFPMFIFGFVNTEFLPISKETFIGAWLGSLLGVVTIKGFELITTTNEKE